MVFIWLPNLRHTKIEGQFRCLLHTVFSDPHHHMTVKPIGAILDQSSIFLQGCYMILAHQPYITQVIDDVDFVENPALHQSLPTVTWNTSQTESTGRTGSTSKSTNPDRYHLCP